MSASAVPVLITSSTKDASLAVGVSEKSRCSLSITMRTYHARKYATAEGGMHAANPKGLKLIDMLDLWLRENATLHGTLFEKP